MRRLINKYTLLNLITIILILALPYYLFEGKLFIGGDDTRLQYLYPEIYLKYLVPFSWSRFASLGWTIASQFYLPFLTIWSILKLFIKDLHILNYLSFSLPIIFGFVYFQKFLNELVNDQKYKFEIYAGTLFFIFSPIIVYDQFFIFLTPIWLLGLIPLIFYYYIRYLRTSNFMNVFKAVIGTTVFSLVSLSVPWVLGVMLPLFISFLILSFMFTKKEVIFGIKKAIVFFGVLIFSQSFWVLGYILSYIQLSSNSFAAKVFNQGFQDTFSPTVLATATGSIFYPMLNLFHRQIAFDFDWDLRNVFLNFYDKTYILNVVFIVVLFIGFVTFKKVLKKAERRIYLVSLLSFIISLYFFTVNIGPLKELFLALGKFPLFTMFRNFSDKFSLGFAFLFAILITLSLVIAKKQFKNSKKLALLITPVFLLVVVINIIPIKQTVNAPLWKTEHIYKGINFPAEYVEFMKNVGKKVTPNNIILSVPFGASTYTVVKDEDTNNVYLGTSPVVIFSGVSDMSGYLSFNFTNEANIVNDLIIKRKYDEFNDILFKHNINYVVFTKNIPDEVKQSYAFYPEILNAQDAKFLNAIADKKLLSSSKGNYELYSAKEQNSIIKSNNAYFQRKNPTTFKIYIKNLKSPQDLSFIESFNPDWNLYLVKNPNLDFCNQAINFSNFKTVECKENFKVYNGDISYFLRKPVFEESHNIENDFSNIWKISPEYVKNNFGKDYYKLNKDGSIDIELDLYFRPQVNFYLGLGLSIVVFIGCILYLILKRKNEKNK